MFLLYNITWCSDIELLCKKISRSKLIVSADELVSVYFYHTERHLLYDVFVWGNYGNVRKTVNKEAIRIILYIEAS